MSSDKSEGIVGLAPSNRELDNTVVDHEVEEETARGARAKDGGSSGVKAKIGAKHMDPAVHGVSSLSDSGFEYSPGNPLSLHSDYNFTNK